MVLHIYVTFINKQTETETVDWENKNSKFLCLIKKRMKKRFEIRFTNAKKLID